MARDFQPKREGSRDDLFAAMPAVEAKKVFYSGSLQGMREKRRVQGHDEVKLMFVDVRKAHLNVKCDDEELVELPDEFKTNWELRQVEEMAVRDEKGSVEMGGRLRKEDWWRMGFDAAEHHQRYSTIPRRRCESSMHGDAFTFAGTESELKRILMKTHIATKDENSMNHDNLVHNFILHAESEENSGRRSSSGKRMEKLETVQAWMLIRSRARRSLFWKHKETRAKSTLHH